jgi:hypothetical protein
VGLCACLKCYRPLVASQSVALAFLDCPGLHSRPPLGALVRVLLALRSQEKVNDRKSN